jgi:hypothetical protein
MISSKVKPLARDMLFRICKFSRKVGWEEIMQAGFYRGKVAIIIDPETNLVWC